jgi:predicted site-specific integrase-resolvase
MIRLKDFAKRRGISYMTAWRWWKQGLIKGEQIGSVIYVDDTEELSIISIESIIKELAKQHNISYSIAKVIYDRGFSDGFKYGKTCLCS